MAECLSRLVKEAAIRHLPDLLAAAEDSERLSALLRGLEDRLDQLLQEVEISPQVADFVASALMTYVVTPDNVRMAIVWLLIDEHVEVMVAHLRDRAGMLRFVVSMVDPRAMLMRLRAQLLDHPEPSNRVLAGLLLSLQVEARMRTAIRAFSPRDLPRDLLSRFRAQLLDAMRQYALRSDRQALIALVEGVALEGVLLEALKALPPEVYRSEVLETARRDVAGYLGSFLEAELSHRAEKERERQLAAHAVRLRRERRVWLTVGLVSGLALGLLGVAAMAVVFLR